MSEYSFYVIHKAHGAGANVVLEVPREPGLCLTTAVGGTGGLTWAKPPESRVETRVETRIETQVVAATVATVAMPDVQQAPPIPQAPQDEWNGGPSAARSIHYEAGALTDISDKWIEAFRVTVAGWSICPRVTVYQFGRTVTVQISAFVATLLARDFIGNLVLPPAMSTTHVVISAHGGEAKTSALAAVTGDGSVRLWPEMMRNSEAWSDGATVGVDGFSFSYIAA